MLRCLSERASEMKGHEDLSSASVEKIQKTPQWLQELSKQPIGSPISSPKKVRFTIPPLHKQSMLHFQHENEQHSTVFNLFHSIRSQIILFAQVLFTRSEEESSKKDNALHWYEIFQRFLRPIAQLESVFAFAIFVSTKLGIWSLHAYLLRLYKVCTLKILLFIWCRL